MKKTASWGPHKSIIASATAFTIVFLFLPAQLVQALPPADHIVINEVLYDPVGADTGKEWIELYNPTESDINLSGWSIETAGTSFTETFSWPPDEEHIIPKQSFYLVGEENISNTNIKGTLDFQNGGSASDGVRIINNEGTIIDTLLYDSPNVNNLPDDTKITPTTFAPDVKEGQTLARINDGVDTNNTETDFTTTITPTPNAPNIITEEELPDEEEDIEEKETTTNTQNDPEEGSSKEYPKKLDIQTVKEQENNTWVQVEGIVIVSPNTIAADTFYIQDNSAGIKIYFSKEDFPTLPLGMSIRVIGKKSESMSETKINIQERDDIEILNQQDLKTPTQVQTGEINESHEGLLISTTGTIVRKHGTTLYIDDGSGEMKITISKHTNISPPETEKGDTIAITGIVSQNNDGYRILPRIQEDLQLASLDAADTTNNNEEQPKNLPRAGSSVVLPIAIALLLTIITRRLLYRS